MLLQIQQSECDVQQNLRHVDKPFQVFCAVDAESGSPGKINMKFTFLTIFFEGILDIFNFFIQ